MLLYFHTAPSNTTLQDIGKKAYWRNYKEEPVQKKAHERLPDFT